MKKIFAVLAVTMMVAGASTTAASARSWHHYRHSHHYGWLGFRSSNAELRGNNANSAGGRNSLANPNVAAGIGK